MKTSTFSLSSKLFERSSDLQKSGNHIDAFKLFFPLAKFQTLQLSFFLIFSGSILTRGNQKKETLEIRLNDNYRPKMGEFSRKIDVEKLLSYSNDLVGVLKDKRDINSLTQCLDHSKSLQSSCEADLSQGLSSIQDYRKRIDACKQKTEWARSEVATDAEADHLRNEFQEELERERELQEELRIITNEINDLEHQRISLEELKRAMKKCEKDELRAQMKLSMYASVTNIIPNLDDQLKVSGYIVDRDKKVVEKFEYDPAKITAFDTCHTIWKAINL